MPIKPKPTTYKCPSCNWQKIVAPQSDAIMPWEHFDQCPECGETELTTKIENSVDIVDKVLNIFNLKN